jgi:hypothetical protein
MSAGLSVVLDERDAGLGDAHALRHFDLRQFQRLPLCRQRHRVPTVVLVALLKHPRDDRRFSGVFGELGVDHRSDVNTLSQVGIEVAAPVIPSIRHDDSLLCHAFGAAAPVDQRMRDGNGLGVPEEHAD